MKYPKIYLALDNCFAIKRWVEPETWLPLTQELGYTSAEASFDNEIDLLYSTKEYREEWLARLAAAEEKTGVKVRSFFTGYQTYRTAGLAHPDEKVSGRIMEKWMKPAIEMTGRRGNDMGVSIHCIPEAAMENPEEYERVHEKLYKIYSELGACAKENGDIKVCIEAMYAPQQTPWTIEGTKDFLRNIYAADGNAIYTTVDVGHMVGQSKFRKPDKEKIKEDLKQAARLKMPSSLWLGSQAVYDLFDSFAAKKDTSGAAAAAICEEMEKYGYQFSVTDRDSDMYAWIEELACYSPIMHLQQTDGVTSSHAPFTKENNKKGVVDGKKILESIARSYEKEEKGMPPKTERIVLALELFAANVEHPRGIKEKLKETREYWKKFIPEDGMYLDELLERLS